MNLGITGGIASGKTTVLNILHDLGAAVVDADEIARQLTAPGTPLSFEIIRLFGIEYSVGGEPGTIDRAKLGAAIFHDPSLRSKLESATHSLIVGEIRLQMNAAKLANPKAVIAVEIPLLFEVGLDSLFDKVIVVWCSKRTQMKRLRARTPHLDDHSIMERIQSQMPLDDKRTKADFVIDTEKPLKHVKFEVSALYHLFDSIEL